MERPLTNKQMMDLLAKQEQEDMTPAERRAVRSMPTPDSKPSAKQIAAKKQEKQKDYAANRQRVIRHLQKRGLSNAAIAGIVGNIDVETGGSFDHTLRQTVSGRASDPRTIESGGYGLFQFDDYAKNSGHESWYKGYLKDKGKKDSPEAQLDYLLDMVMAGADKQDPNFKYAKKMGETNASTLKAYLTTNTNPSQIADAITDRFEKPGSPHSARRRASAQETFEELAPRDRADMDMDAQYINQSGGIRDTDTDVPIVDVPNEKSTYEKIKPYIPILRHFNEGGMALEKQMELFEDGGLMDEGGTTDPVSGNDVPPGSTQEEVRDDIPAQLSEGEFVFPADVVRYIGLEKLMQMRQEAKQGLQMMEDMGQMGNGDEAVMPDDIPFDLSDLDMDDDLEYNVGGFVPGVQQQQFTGIAGYRPPQMQQGVGSYVPAPMPQYQATPMPGAYTPPQQAAVPTMQVPTQMPQFGQFTEQNVDNREYTNSETGEKRVFTFINGQPTIPIPPGFVPSSEYVKPETAKPVDTKVETARVVERDDSDDESRRKKEEEDYGPSGGRLGVAGNIYGVSFDTAGEGLPGMVGMATTLGKVVSGNLPDDTIVNFQNPQTGQFSISGSQYNNLKAIISGEGANSPTAEQYINDLRQDYDDNIQNIANEYRLDSSGKSSSQVIKEASKASGQDAADLIRGAKARRDLQKHNEEVARKAADKRRQEEKAEAARINREAEIRRQAEATRRANEAAAAKAAATSQSDSDDSGYSSNVGGGGVSSSVREAVAEAGGYTGGGRYGGFAEGGLAAKPKPKAKKMKRGGLASKK